MSYEAICTIFGSKTGSWMPLFWYSNRGGQEPHVHGLMLMVAHER